MTALLVVAGIGLILLPGLRAFPFAELPPSEWTRVASASMRCGLLSLRVGLVLGAVPTILRASGVQDLASVCHRMLGPVVPGGAVAGWASAAATVVLGWRSFAARRRAAAAQQAARVDSWLGTHAVAGGVDVVTLPTQRTIAYAVSGYPPQIVLTDGLVEVLTADELDAVVRHERSHLVHGHEQLLALAAAADATVGWLPGVRRSTAALRLAVERWADEDAAAAGEASRPALHRALLKTTARMLDAVPAFATACTVVDRLAALEQPAPRAAGRARALAVAPVASLSIGVTLSLVVWTLFTHHGLLGAVGYCPA
jgi:hypothetical protein